MGNNVGVFFERTTAGPLSVGADTGDSVFIAVTSERGMANVAQLVTSHDQYRQIFGGANGTTYSDGVRMSDGDEVLKMLFNKAQAPVYVVRVVGTNAVNAYVAIPDRYDEDENEESAPSIRVYAKGPGLWAENYNVHIADGTRTNTFKLTVQYSGTGSAPWTTLETFDNLAMTDASLATVGEQSQYVYIVNQNSTNADPRPANDDYALDATVAGVDDNAPSASLIIGTDSSGVKTGLKCFRDVRFGRGFIIAPGLDSGSTVRDEMAAQYDTYLHYPLFGFAAATSVSTMLAATPPSAPCSIYYPNRVVEDAITGELKEVSPVGEVLGNAFKVLRTQTGLGRHWGGKDFPMGAVKTQTNGQPLIDATVAALMLAKGVNPIWDDGTGGGNRVMGARSWYGMQTDTSWSYAHAAYLYMYIADRLGRALAPVVFNTVETTFFENVEAGGYALLYDMAVNGKAFTGRIPAPGTTADETIHAFDIKCNEGLMTPLDLANNSPRVKVWFKDSVSAETVNVSLAKMNIA